MLVAVDDNIRQMRARARRNRYAFTLVELLVVVAIIALLVSILLPTMGRSIRQARATVCQSNLKDLYRAMDMYRTDNGGWLPAVDPSNALRSTDSWAVKLFANNHSGAAVLICPDDPWAAVMRNSLSLPTADLGGAASYGFNDFIASSPNSFLANIGRHNPKRPDETILLADMGPDLTRAESGSGGIVPPVRNYGRLSIDDGYRPGAPPGHGGDPWLTPRHLDGINVLSLLGNVRKIRVEAPLSRVVSAYYPECAARQCTICIYLDLPHYSFAEAGAFWWTGTLPKP